jgi:hypothetical protein
LVTSSRSKTRKQSPPISYCFTPPKSTLYVLWRQPI